MPKTIVMTTWRRPEYTRRTLEALARCHGVGDYQLLIRCEPDHHEVVSECDRYPHRKQITVNPGRLGCTGNVHAALTDGFAVDDFVILVEDDVLLAPDALIYFEWCRENYHEDAEVFTACGYRKRHARADESHTVEREPWFTPWGWGTWRDRFDEMSANWNWGSGESWDIVVNRCRGTRNQVVPMLARCQNIGAEHGCYCPGPEWHRQNQFNEFWAGSVSGLLVNAQFAEVDPNRLNVAPQ